MAAANNEIRMGRVHGCQRLTGKVAIVTASTLGIGRAIVQRLAEEGASVVVSSRKQENVDATVSELVANGLVAIGVPCHVGKADDRAKLIADTVAQFGKIDIVVSNAAVQPSAGLTLDAEDPIFDKIFDVNVKSHWQLIREAAPHMAAGSSVVFVSSVGAYSPAPPLGLYGVSKTALLGLTKALAVEMGSNGIRVNCVAPGLVRTKFAKILWENENVAKAQARNTWIGRIGDPEDLAGPTAFLASDDSAWMTGETLIVSGGVPVSRL